MRKHGLFPFNPNARDPSFRLNRLSTWTTSRFVRVLGRVTTRPLGYVEALTIVDRLRARFSGSQIFGVEKDKGLDSGLGDLLEKGVEVLGGVNWNSKQAVLRAER